ncbi:unnamed protein product [Mytilus coruscus]|uniref:DZIP3-like HEPN domain-containing protein n=1 Tax=Mytilus coruscus TaxID=42192 RepID=A0A6J8C6K0_MYTCO|nr:unnamed protein product [Mytilus coruscus]
MEEVPPDRERLYYMKCLAFILGIGMDVLLNYFEQKILGNSDFYCFVEDNKHYLYHAHNPSIKCCECSTLLLASSYKTRGLNKRQFEILFDIGLPTDMVHYQVGSNNQMTQDCLCRFMPKPSNDVDCMDITLMNAVIKACFFDRKLSIHGSPTDLETFKNTRNYLAHSSDRRLSESEFKTKLQESEQAILGIAKSVGKYFAKESKRKIDAFKQDELSVAQIKRIIESNADGVSRVDELKVDIGKISFDVRQNARWAISSSSREATLERRGNLRSKRQGKQGKRNRRELSDWSLYNYDIGRNIPVPWRKNLIRHANFHGLIDHKQGTQRSKGHPSQNWMLCSLLLARFYLGKYSNFYDDHISSSYA